MIRTLCCKLGVVVKLSLLSWRRWLFDSRMFGRGCHSDYTELNNAKRIKVILVNGLTNRSTLKGPKRQMGKSGTDGWTKNLFCQVKSGAVLWWYLPIYGIPQCCNTHGFVLLRRVYILWNFLLFKSICLVFAWSLPDQWSLASRVFVSIRTFFKSCFCCHNINFCFLIMGVSQPKMIRKRACQTFEIPTRLSASSMAMAVVFGKSFNWEKNNASFTFCQWGSIVKISEQQFSKLSKNAKLIWN